jgi:processing peptidase subunit alpha
VEPSTPIDRSKMLVSVPSMPARAQIPVDQPLPDIPIPALSKIEKPEIKISTLSNGLRVISHETFGQVSNVGLSIAVGSRFETDEEKGLNHLLEFMMMKGTRLRSHQRIVEDMEQMGAHVSIKTGREQMMMHIDVLRNNAEQAVELLCESVTSPLFLDDEIEYQKMSMALDYEHLHLSSIEMMNELILQAAYGPDSELGAGNAHR